LGLTRIIYSSRLAIPAILILPIGGVISFLLAYNFYPEKQENVTVDGKFNSLFYNFPLRLLRKPFLWRYIDAVMFTYL
jgi:hypothetical protein